MRYIAPILLVLILLPSATAETLFVQGKLQPICEKNEEVFDYFSEDLLFTYEFLDNKLTVKVKVLYHNYYDKNFSKVRVADFSDPDFSDKTNVLRITANGQEVPYEICRGQNRIQVNGILPRKFATGESLVLNSEFELIGIARSCSPTIPPAIADLLSKHGVVCYPFDEFEFSPRRSVQAIQGFASCSVAAILS